MSMTRLPKGIFPGDFDVIEDAVMETVKGRWFLAEYGRRLRHSEAERVLAAVRRLEARLEPPPSQIWRDPEEFAQGIDDIASELQSCAYALREGMSRDEMEHHLHQHVSALKNLALLMRAPVGGEAHAGEIMPPVQDVSAHEISEHADEDAIKAQEDVALDHAPDVVMIAQHVPARPSPFAVIDDMKTRQRSALFG
jgi:hypothetical protein